MLPTSVWAGRTIVCVAPYWALALGGGRTQSGAPFRLRQGYGRTSRAFALGYDCRALPCAGAPRLRTACYGVTCRAFASLCYGIHPLSMDFSVVQSSFTSLAKGEVCIIDLNLKTQLFLPWRRQGKKTAFFFRLSLFTWQNGYPKRQCRISQDTAQDGRHHCSSS